MHIWALGSPKRKQMCLIIPWSMIESVRLDLDDGAYTIRIPLRGEAWDARPVDRAPARELSNLTTSHPARSSAPVAAPVPEKRSIARGGSFKNGRRGLIPASFQV